MEEETTIVTTGVKVSNAIRQLNSAVGDTVRRVLKEHGLNGAKVSIEIERDYIRGSDECYYKADTNLTFDY